MSDFNNKDIEAFGSVYLLYRPEFVALANKMLSSAREIDGEDLVQDIFVSIWNNNRVKFSCPAELKKYIYISIRNKIKELFRHDKIFSRIKALLCDDNYFIASVSESEILSVINKTINMLPAECAKVLKMYINGDKIKDIAEKTGKSESTVYKQTQYGLNSLKKNAEENILTITMITQILLFSLFSE